MFVRGNNMRNQREKPEEWVEQYYRVESDYAQQILLSPKNSMDRLRLFQEGYNEITKIINTHNPGGGETNYTDLVVSLIKKRLNKGSSVFDIGCASGNLLYELAVNGYDIEGIDVSDELIKMAKDKLRLVSKSNSVNQSDIVSYNPQKPFDCIVMDNVIEHFHPDSVDDILQKCHKMLKKDGYIVILTPHKFSGPHDISKHFLPLGSKAKGFHLKEFSFTDLQMHLKQAGFQTVLGFPYHPRLFRKINLIPDCSEWSGRKAIMLENLFENTMLKRTLLINPTLSHIIVAILFPAICVAKKSYYLK